MFKIKLKQLEDIHDDHVYLKDDLKITTPLGEVKEFDPGKNYATISATKPGGGKKTLSEAIIELLTKDKDPAVTMPSLTLSLTPHDSYAEVGSDISVRPLATFSPGEYEFGPATGISAQISAKLENGNTQIDTLELTSGTRGTFQSCRLRDGDVLTVLARATHSQGDVPLTQLGKTAPWLQIAAGDVESPVKKAVTAFRSYFGGCIAKSDIGNLDSAKIRNNKTTAIEAPAKNKTFNLNPSSSDGRVYVAIPADFAATGINAILTTSQNADITSQFVKLTARVQVEGANGSTAVPYDVWICNPSRGWQGDENIKITILK